MQNYNERNADLDDCDKFPMFFSMLKKFNGGTPISNDFKMRIEEFFHNKWTNDKNLAFINDEDLIMMDQVPQDTQNRIFQDFLYFDFLKAFKQTFRFINPKGKVMNFEDENYRNFIINMLSCLEPRFENRGTTMYKEGDEISEFIYVTKGKYNVGFELGGKNKFVLQFKDRGEIGQFPCTFNAACRYQYKAHTNLHGYFIRKNNWKEILDQDLQIKGLIRRNVKFFFVKDV